MPKYYEKDYIRLQEIRNKVNFRKFHKQKHAELLVTPPKFCSQDNTTLPTPKKEMSEEFVNEIHIKTSLNNSLCSTGKNSKQANRKSRFQDDATAISESKQKTVSIDMNDP